MVLVVLVVDVLVVDVLVVVVGAGSSLLFDTATAMSVAMTVITTAASQDEQERAGGRCCG